MSSYAIMTNTGRNKEAQALASGGALTITHIAWGDGARDPSGGETALLNEVGRKPVQGTGSVPEALNTAFFEILLDANEGPYVIREAGLFDDAGDLVAVAKYDPPVNKPKDTVSALLRIHVVFSDLENLVLQVQSTDAYVPVERKIISGTGLTGGGDLSEDRTLAVVFASEAEAKEATEVAKTMSPKLALDTMIAKAGMGGEVPEVTDLDALDRTCSFYFKATAVGAPDPAYDGRGLHLQSDGEATQFVVIGHSKMLFRDWDTQGNGWAAWRTLLTDIGASTASYSVANASDALLIGENFNGDTAISLAAVSGHCHRMGNLAHISLYLEFEGFSMPTSSDGGIATNIDINTLAGNAGWFAALASGGGGDAFARYTGGGGWDAPWMKFNCSANQAAGTLYVATGDTTHIPTMGTDANGLELKLNITVLVED